MKKIFIITLLTAFVTACSPPVKTETGSFPITIFSVYFAIESVRTIVLGEDVFDQALTTSTVPDHGYHGGFTLMRKMLEIGIRIDNALCDNLF